MTAVEVAQLPLYCGNKKVDSGEQCDDGPANSNIPNAHCRTDCRLRSCGDGILDAPAEACDDGNTVSGDACSNICKLERLASGNEPSQTLPAQIIDLPFQSGVRTAPPNTVPGGYYEEQVMGIGSASGSGEPPANAQTGPAAVAIMVSGAAAGYAYMRRRRA